SHQARPRSNLCLPRCSRRHARDAELTGRTCAVPVAAGWAVFVAGAVASLGASYFLVTRLERIGEWLGLSGALLGMVAALAADAPALVIGASVAMERAATALGTHFAVPAIVTGGVVLAAVTSLPNAVSAVYLAARGRGAAMLSTTLNSNALNVSIGLLLPATITGLGAPSGQADLIALWYLALTLIALAYAYRDSGMSRRTGALIIGAYLVFLG